MSPYQPEEALLRHHGDADVEPGLVDLAVNVRAGTPPAWLRDACSAADLAQYPNPTAARSAVAQRHRRGMDEVLITAGAAEAFVLIARAFSPRHAVVVHPQFTEPELALRSAGHDVDRVVLDWPFLLDPAVVPGDADLVVVGNPTNPTSVLHPADALRSLARPGRLLVVDEAFADCVPGEPESLAASGDVPGLIVVRSLTKMWGLAGLRVGYALAAPDIIGALAGAQSHWAASTPALVACVECSTPAAVAEADEWANGLAGQRDHLVGLLAQIPGVETVPGARASFVLVRVDAPGVRKALRDKGFAVRRGDSFPGLGPEWIRIGVRDERTSSAFAAALTELT
jgi:histidinol-phosphate aminotransferase